MFRYPDLSAKIGRLMDDYVLALRSKDETPGLLLAMTREAEAAILDKYQADVASKQQGIYNRSMRDATNSRVKREAGEREGDAPSSLGKIRKLPRREASKQITLQRRNIRSSWSGRARSNARRSAASCARSRSSTRRVTQPSTSRTSLSSCLGRISPPQSLPCMMKE